MKKAISSPKAPQPLGPYSQAVYARDLKMIFLSGQIPIDPQTNKLVTGDIAAQTEQVMRHIQQVLLAAGINFKNVVKTVIFLRDMNHFALVNKVYSRYFEPPYPARSCVAVRELPLGADVEIEVVAVK